MSESSSRIYFFCFCTKTVTVMPFPNFKRSRDDGTTPPSYPDQGDVVVISGKRKTGKPKRVFLIIFIVVLVLVVLTAVGLSCAALCGAFSDNVDDTDTSDNLTHQDAQNHEHNHVHVNRLTAATNSATVAHSEIVKALEQEAERTAEYASVMARLWWFVDGTRAFAPPGAVNDRSGVVRDLAGARTSHNSAVATAEVNVTMAGERVATFEASAAVAMATLEVLFVGENDDKKASVASISDLENIRIKVTEARTALVAARASAMTDLTLKRGTVEQLMIEFSPPFNTLVEIKEDLKQALLFKAENPLAVQIDSQIAAVRELLREALYAQILEQELQLTANTVAHFGGTSRTITTSAFGKTRLVDEDEDEVSDGEDKTCVQNDDPQDGSTALDMFVTYFV